MEEFTPEFFDAASAAWRENKIAIGGGSFAYKCAYKHSNGKMCNKMVSGQKPVLQYITHPNWSQQCRQSSMEFCKKHHIRGPQQKGNK
jgi:hypothetical protein